MATSNDVADVLIVGSGASGGALAWYLSKSPGIKVVCLEQGDWIQEPRFNPAAAIEQEKRRLMQLPEPEGSSISLLGIPTITPSPHGTPPCTMVSGEVPCTGEDFSPDSTPPTSGCTPLTVWLTIGP